MPSRPFSGGGGGDEGCRTCRDACPTQSVAGGRRTVPCASGVASAARRGCSLNLAMAHAIASSARAPTKNDHATAACARI